MHTLLFALMGLAFFVLYNTSLKVKYEGKSSFTTWIRSHRKPAVLLAYGLLLILAVAFILLDGIAIGAFTFFIGLMFIASLIIAMDPLYLLRQKYVFLLLGGCLFVELILF